MNEVIVSDNGEPPILLARAPGQVAAQPTGSGAIVFRGARSGNKNFDPITGKFAGNKPKALQVVAQTVQAGALPLQSGIPAGVDPLVWGRRLDAVREAGRQLEMMDAATAQKFLTGRVADINQVDINQFLADVRMQRISDLVDILDTNVRARRAKLPVRVVAPTRWTTRAFAGLSAPEIGHLVKRLEGKGWDAADITKNVVKKVKNPELRAQLEQLYGEAKPKSGKQLPAPVGTGK